MTLENKSILLVISGGIAAYKSLELIRLIKKSGGQVRAIITKGGEQFVTPMSVSALCEHEAYTDLWSLKDESEMRHIRLSRDSDLIVVVPASADIIAKMAHGLANDLASTTLLAADKDILIAPAMNHKMWDNAATTENVKTLQKRGMLFVGPDQGDMACGEYGYGRMAEPEEIFASITSYFQTDGKKPLDGKTALVTAGPTYEPIDPVRFIGNRSSGKQGYAIAAALEKAGAKVTLVSGPVSIQPPENISVVEVQTATDMLDACKKSLPVDIAVLTAAVSDWSAKTIKAQKIKKTDRSDRLDLELKQTPDILEIISKAVKRRPKLCIGFAAETENLIHHAKDKQKRKGCDWIIANSVLSDRADDTVFGADDNHAFLIKGDQVTEWPKTSKSNIAEQLVSEIIAEFKNMSDDEYKADQNTDSEHAAPIAAE